MSFKYPKPLKKGETIAVTAPSSGVGENVERYQFVKQGLIKAGYSVLEGNCLFDSVRHVSGSATARAEDFMKLWLNPEVAAIIPPWGGEMLIQILEHLDWEKLATSEPKWCMGYSDISLLLSTITWHTGVVTAHGTNLLEMVETETENLTKNALEPLKNLPGSSGIQRSAEKFVTSWLDYKTHPDSPYNFTEPVKWKTISGAPEVFTGRAIGGCIDVLMAIVGTKYDQMTKFRSFCGDDKVILYLENCELSTNQFYRALYQLKYSGWFDGLAGVVLGRNAGPSSVSQPYEGVLKEFFSDFSFPVIFDADIGHRQPNLTILNGASTTFRCNLDGGGEMNIEKR